MHICSISDNCLLKIAFTILLQRTIVTKFKFSQERSVSVPCFLKDVCRPLLRAGQQLQVLIKLLDMCNCMTTRDQSYERGALLSNLADVLPYWNDSTSEHVSCSFPLTFMKRNMEAMVLKRETLYRMLQEKLENLFPRLSIRCWQISSNVIGCCSFIYINCFSCFVIFI